MLVCNASHAYMFFVFGLNSIYRFKVKNFNIDLCIKCWNLGLHAGHNEHATMIVAIKGV